MLIRIFFDSESLILKILLIIVAVVQAQAIDLNDSNFTSFAQQHLCLRGVFYAPWCSHYKALAPKYEKLGYLAKRKDYIISKVDATDAEKMLLPLERKGSQQLTTRQ